MKRKQISRTSSALVLAAAVVLCGRSARAAISVNETIDQSDIGSQTALFVIPPSTIVTQDTFVLAGTEAVQQTPPLGTTPVSGKALPSFAANFSTDHVFQLNLQAPAGEQFVVNLPAGTQGAFDFQLQFATANGSGVTLVPNSAVSLSLDGVPQSITPDSSGIDPAGQDILIEGSSSAVYSSSFTFHTLTVALDYSVDTGNQPITLANATNTLDPLGSAYLSFATGAESAVDLGSITVAPIPEPTSMALFALSAIALLNRRRQGCTGHFIS